MRWRKLGHIFCAENNAPWMQTHAANPVAEHIAGSLYRVYFSARDSGNRSSICWLEIDLRDPTRVVRVADHPVVGPGRTGAFDDSGASMGCLVRVGDVRYLYYVGWNLGVTVPWRNSIGLLVSSGSEEFRRASEGPVMDRDHHDPFSISYPWVLVEHGRWRMWYGSNLDWGSKQADMAHAIKYAESTDAKNWHREGRIAIPLEGAEEYALSKPCVLRDVSGYRMWYSHRGTNYRIGYAESADGSTWKRRDRSVGIGVSEFGWDSESICYPCVFSHGAQRYMLYNGNRYGLTGFGIAILESE